MAHAAKQLDDKQRRIFALLLPAFFGIIGGLLFWKPMTLVVIGAVPATPVLISLAFNGTSPRVRQLAGFLMPVLFAGAGGAVVLSEAVWPVAIVVWCLGVLLGLVTFALPGLGRGVLALWMSAGEPIGWSVTAIAMLLVFYLAVTPVGLLMRLAGKDPMQRRLDPQAATYWIKRDPVTDKKRYFRQF